MFSNPTVEPSSAPTKSLTILVADDQIDVQRCVRAWLQELGHDVHCVSSGMEAALVIRQQIVDLVITEVILPNGDGLELITALRKSQPHARVIACSGGGRYLTGADCLRVAKGLGAHEILPKPLKREELLPAIDRAMAGAPEKALRSIGVGSAAPFRLGA